MNRIDPRVLDWWIAYYRVEPFGREWEQSAGIAFEVARLNRTIQAMHGVDTSSLPEIEFADFMPGDMTPIAPSSPKMTIDQEIHQAEQIAAAYAR